MSLPSADEMDTKKPVTEPTPTQTPMSVRNFVCAFFALYFIFLSAMEFTAIAMSDAMRHEFKEPANKDDLAQNLTTITGTTMSLNTVPPTLANPTATLVITIFQTPTPPSAPALNSIDGTDNDDGSKTILSASSPSDNATPQHHDAASASEARAPQLPMTAINLPDLPRDDKLAIDLAQDTVTTIAEVWTTTTPGGGGVSIDTLPPTGGLLPWPSITDTPAASAAAAAAATTTDAGRPPEPFPLPLTTIPSFNATTLETLATSATMGSGSATRSSHSGARPTAVAQPLRRAAGALVCVACAMALAF